jgi:hypothetical protein
MDFHFTNRVKPNTYYDSYYTCDCDFITEILKVALNQLVN